eukprot:728897-Pyramimonas_sp.AAC.1
MLEGVCGEYDRRIVVNHFAWADNCYRVSAPSTVLAQMMRGLTLPLRDWGMRWEDSSLLYMTCGEFARTDGDGHIPASEDLLIPACSGFRSFSMRRVCRMKVLCHEIYSTYLLPAHPDGEYRIKEARACFIGHADVFRNRAVAIRDNF